MSGGNKNKLEAVLQLGDAFVEEIQARFILVIHKCVINELQLVNAYISPIYFSLHVHKET